MAALNQCRTAQSIRAGGFRVWLDLLMTAAFLVCLGLLLAGGDVWFRSGGDTHGDG